MSTASAYEPLWEPIALNQLEVRNRLLVSAHTTAFFDDPFVGDRQIDYFEERARGGVGLLILGAEGVHPHGWHPPHFQAWRKEAEPRFRKLAERVGDHGAAVFTQLWHSGLQDTGVSLLENEHPLLAPSGIASPMYGRIAKQMEQAEIEEVIQAFGEAAEVARAGGLHGIEVGGAHGYLISGFLSTFNNQREDEYGGSVENRCRLAVEVGTEIRRRVGADYPVGFRMSFEEYVGPGGFEPEQVEELLAEIHGHRLFDYFSVSAGTYHSMWGFITPGTSPLELPNVASAARAKEIVADEVPIMVAQKVLTLDQAAEIVQSRQADMVAMTRAHIADPELVRKAQEGKARQIRRCVGFNQGCVARQVTGTMVTCTVNPVVGREARWSKFAPSSDPRRVTVVGGGPAGMRFAEAAAERGHSVRLLERAEELGGMLRFAARLPNRGRWADLIEDLSLSIERVGVTVELGSEATADGLRDEGADLVVLATGSRFDTSGFSVFRQDRRRIEGADLENVIDPVAAIEGGAGDSVVVVDDVGNHASLGVAQLLGEAGKRVHLVTMQPLVGQQLTTTFEVPQVLYPQLVAAGVSFHPWTTVEAITPGDVSLRQVWTGEALEIAADTVVMNTHRRPVDALYEELKGRGPAVKRIGDCLAPRQVDDAIFEATQLGFELERLFTAEPASAGVVD